MRFPGRKGSPAGARFLAPGTAPGPVRLPVPAGCPD